MTIDQPTTAKPRWFHLTPGRLLVVLLAVEGILLLSERWFPKGWAVLVAVAAVGLFLIAMLLWLIFSLILHWRFQFSLRSILVLTVAVAIPSSWLAVELKWATEQKEAVDAIEKMGGSVSYDYQYDSSDNLIQSANPPGAACLQIVFGDDFFINVTDACFCESKVTDVDLRLLVWIKHLKGLSLATTQITNAGLEHLNELPQLRYLELSGTTITAAGLKPLEALKQLQSLDLKSTNIKDVGLEHLEGAKQLRVLILESTQITDAGLERLKGLNQLVRLDLVDNRITDAGLAHLSGLDTLVYLDLQQTDVTDSGLKHLNGLTQLQHLDLSYTKITDAGLEELCGLKQLHNLNLAKTQATYDGVERLRKTLPNIEIHYDRR